MLMGKKISLSKADQLVNKGAKLYDVRDPVSFRDGTLSGAVNMSLRQISQLQKMPKNQELIFFGTGDDDTTLQMVLNYVHQFGFTKVYVVDKPVK